MNYKLTIENDFYRAAFETIGSIINNRFKSFTDFNSILELVRKEVPFFKSGQSGSHIWISLHNNERIAIIR